MDGTQSAGYSERTVLVGVEKGTPGEWMIEESLDELAQLVETAGGVPCARLIQRRERPSPHTFIGKGKVDELKEVVEAEGAELVVFDDELTPAQVRNLEEDLAVRVIDRAQVILDIFAQRARSRAGKLQVELAQLRYLLPRLSGHGVSLSRLGGGIGTRGPGETKLEVDRRRIRTRIANLRRDLSEVEQHRALQRESRRLTLLPLVALVGYTNAGKSTLLRRLTGADVLVEDRLFATLDPTIRSVDADAGPGFLLIDTVGFINKLPHELVAAFRATLDEVVEADVLIHVIDASNPNFENQAHTVFQVLDEIGAGGHPVVTAFNKVDRLEPGSLGGWLARTPHSVAISAQTGSGLDELVRTVEAIVPDPVVRWELAIPYDQGHVLSWLHEHGRVHEQRYAERVVEVSVELTRSLAERIKQYRLA